MSYLKDELKGFVPTPQAAQIMKDIARGSSIMRLGNVKPMTSESEKFPILAEGPGAYWVGEGERIKTSKATWIFPEIIAKKLAVIIPVTKEKLNDTTINVFEELKGPIAEAFYKALDAACFMGCLLYTSNNSHITWVLLCLLSTSGKRSIRRFRSP